ncbi:long-chain fatty acid--CoA ligase [Rhodococcus sp. D2-41]|uniref:Acyl-CoA synthetase n=1 Tax=Speluncibacter jeojiensis TaxID=2710754 RepID=A0A9X4LXG8_9ACTN|nr:long-chain fatty acid--CoA ligase [Rhodococcus sp. D2-41]MDG3011954.1 long-chain fatty acid--CoA ligase [Rhodococcus sp. D2-41]MDG3013406.1 long-chain fatty acid--CoA ligase [Corynebacteriales bacterium D3-21]
MREFSAPATFAIADDESVVGAVFDFAETDPDLVVFLRSTASRWADVTAAEFAGQVTAVAKGLIALGVQPGDRVALMSATRYEWPLIDYAIWSAGAVTVPIYETSSPDQVDWILRDSAATALVVETHKHTAAVHGVADAAPQLRHYLQIEPSGDDTGAVAELTAAGADVPDEQVHERIGTLRATSPATLIYTSGTTGRPKGCELTHGNLLSEARGAVEAFSTELRPGRRSLMFLPMAHVLARAISIAAFQAKVALGHFSDIPQLVPTFAVFKPNFILSVPRVFEKVYNTARQKAHTESSVKGRIFDLAEATAIEWSQARDHGGPGLLLNLRHTLFDRLVYSKLRAALGGECSIAISGGAPLGERLGHFFRGIGVTIYEGYGLTETTAAVTVNTIGSQKIGTVGKPLAGNAVRIGEDGEILLRGGVVFHEYWNNEAATADAITDGWFHTGDLGALDAEGYLTITGRKKEIIVTAGGKNVAPAVLEDGLRAHPLVSQAMVVGDKKPFIGALVTIDPEEFPRWKERNGKAADATVADLIADADLVAEIDAAVREANKAVSHAESIKKFRVLPVDFTEETGEMTPTMKIKRNVIAKTFADDIEAIYAK